MGPMTGHGTFGLCPLQEEQRMAQMCRFTDWKTRKDIYVNAAVVRTIKAAAKGGTEITFVDDAILTVREPVDEVARVLYAAN